MRKINIKSRDYGYGQRLAHQEHELDNAPVIPLPVEYDDIDKTVIEFFTKNIEMTDDNGNQVPTFRLLSNQRFSEYSQTWEHTDTDGNLLMNFKTVNREINTSWGTIHSGMYNIPDDNRFTLLIRDVKDDNGVEYYEVTSMSQPLSVDLTYNIGFISSKIDKINSFNLQIVNMFKSRQCYIYPNGHAMPMTLESVSDESNYGVDERKFYNLTASVKVMAYIIPKGDIKVEMKPKRSSFDLGDRITSKTQVDVEYGYDSSVEDSIKLNVVLNPGTSKVSFVTGEDMEVKMSERMNANSVHITVNNDDANCEGNILINADDEVSIRIVKPSNNRQSRLVFTGKVKKN